MVWNFKKKFQPLKIEQEFCTASEAIFLKGYCVIKAIRGTRDILPGEVEKWQYVESVARDMFYLCGYREIRTPIIEETGLFIRSIGEATDIVQKEMYSFTDRGERQISLRPEGTAPVLRAYLENGLDRRAGFSKFYYIGPMFRSEKPQAGRSRQFHQAGVEAIGSHSPYLDAEVILLFTSILDKLGINGYLVKLNSVGCSKDRANYNLFLKEGLEKRLNDLCEDCKTRFVKNPLRILDCKRETCREIVSMLPSMINLLCNECSKHFEKLKENLAVLGDSIKVEGHLVRGLDYYTRTVFEVIHPSLGAQDAIGAGGRLDNLMSDLGGEEAGVIGFAMGIERVIQVMESKDNPISSNRNSGVFIVTIGEEAYKKGIEVLWQLRKRGITSDIDYEDRSLKAQMRAADRWGARFVGILGEDELKAGIITLKDMEKGEQSQLGIVNLVEEISKRLK